MESSIYSFLSSENVTDNVIENLKDTLQNHFDLQELMHHYGDHDGFCRLLAETQYNNQEQDSDDSFSAYFTVLSGIVEAVFNHLDLFEVGSQTSIAALQKLCNYNEMCRLYGEKLNENNYLLNYKGSFEEYIDSAKLLPKLEIENKFSYLHSGIKFYGRKDECAAIQEFLEQDKKISIWAITGPGGIGKSKFARHIAETYQHKMSVVWLTDDDFTRIAFIIDSKSNIDYDRTILYICDYAQLKEEQIYKLIIHMINTNYQVRFLLLERSSIWFSRFLNEHTYANEYKFNELPLELSYSSFEDTDFYNILNDFSTANYRRSLTNKEKELILTYTNKLSADNIPRKNQSRCLFLLLVADSYLNDRRKSSGDISETLKQWNENELLNNYINHSKKMIRDMYSKRLMHAIYRILALATSLGELDLDKKYSPMIQKDIDNIFEDLYADCSAIRLLLGEVSETTVESMIVPPLLPDIVGEFLFILEFNNLQKRAKKEWLDLIYRNEHGRAFISRCIADWDTNKQSIQSYIIEYVTEEDEK